VQARSRPRPFGNITGSMALVTPLVEVKGREEKENNNKAGRGLRCGE